VAVALEEQQRIVGKAQREERPVGAAATEHLDLEAVAAAEVQAIPSLRRLACAHLGEHRAVGLDPLDSASTAPPLALVPSRRALTTRVSLTTSRSPSRSSAGRSRKTRSRGAVPVPSSRREALRSAAGCCAISSGGSAKSKSPSV
jgi:hypothetical protein